MLPPLAYSEHPNGSPVAGQYFIHQVISALQANAELWSKTVIVLCYDENGGFFDHVVPPTAPAGYAGRVRDRRPRCPPIPVAPRVRSVWGSECRRW